MASSVKYRRAAMSDLDAVVAMGMLLWPRDLKDPVVADMRTSLSSPDHAVYVCQDDDGNYAGFADFSLRREYVPGVSAYPAGYVEAIYVRPASRRQGVGRKLIALGEEWAAGRGCAQMASDTWLWNTLSQEFHTRSGFSETERLVFYVKRLSPGR